MKVSALLPGGDRRGSKLPTSHTLHYWLPPLFLAFLPPGGGGEVFLGNLGGDVLPGSQILTLFQTVKCYYPHPFSGLKLLTLVYNPFQIRILSCFIVHLQLKWQICSYTPVVPLKTIPGSRQKCARSIPFFRLKWPNNPTLWGSTIWPLKGSTIPGLPPFRPFSIAKYYTQALTSSTFRTPTTHILPATYPSGLPNPRPLPPMNALEENNKDFTVPLTLAYNFKKT